MLKVKMDEAREQKKGALDLADSHRVFEDVLTQYRAAVHGGDARDAKGDFKDFLEQRRPFVGSAGHIKTE